MPKKSRSRSNGEGTIFQRKATGRWCAELVVGWTDEGKKKVLRFNADTRKAAAAWLAERIAEKEKGSLIEPTKLTVGKLLEDWLESTGVRNLKPSTFSNYRQQVRAHIAPEIGHIALTDLNPLHIERLYVAVVTKHGRTKQGCSNRTARLVHCVLSQSLSQAVKWGLIHRNPADAVDAPKVERKEMKFLPPQQIERFLEEAQRERLYPLLALTLMAGLRIGELTGLRWQDVNLDAGTLRIAQQYTYVDGKLLLSTPKSKSSRRHVSIPQAAVAIMKRWKVEQAQERLKAGEGWEHPELVFTSTIGTILQPRNVRRTLDRVLERAGLPRVRFHDLRHSFATWLGTMGVDIGTISKLLGHSRTSITVDTYMHVLEEQTAEAAKKIDAFLTAPKKSAR